MGKNSPRGGSFKDAFRTIQPELKKRQKVIEPIQRNQDLSVKVDDRQTDGPTDRRAIAIGPSGLAASGHNEDVKTDHKLRLQVPVDFNKNLQLPLLFLSILIYFYPMHRIWLRPNKVNVQVPVSARTTFTSASLFFYFLKKAGKTMFYLRNIQEKHFLCRAMVSHLFRQLLGHHTGT